MDQQRKEEIIQTLATIGKQSNRAIEIILSDGNLDLQLELLDGAVDRLTDQWGSRNKKQMPIGEQTILFSEKGPDLPCSYPDKDE